jgi:hypothetical protein
MPVLLCLDQVGKDSITWLEFMLLTPAPRSCMGDVEFVQQAETARRCEPVELRLPSFSDRIASELSLRGAERPSEASALLHLGHLWLPAISLPIS